MPLFTSFNPTKLKPQLKMAITRLQISNNKKSALMKQQIREIAKLLAEDPPKEEKARIKAESLIRDDNTIEACEILGLSCELLSERISLITHSKECPQDLVSSISTLIWASFVVDIPELIEIRKQFRYKYGKQFESDALQNVGGVINERVANKLSVQPPSAYMVQTYLERIADEHGVKWKPKKALNADNMAEPMAAPVGYSVQVGAGSGLNPGEYEVLSAAGGSANGQQEHQASAPLYSPSFDVPPAPTGVMQQQLYKPVVPTNNVPAVGNEKEVAYIPPAPVSNNTSPSVPDNDDDEEVDIYVPGRSSTKHDSTTDENGRTQDAGEDSKPNGGENGAASESYEDLAAKFAKLQR